MTTKRFCQLLLFALSVAGASRDAEGLPFEYQSFDSAESASNAGWTGLRNVEPSVRRDYGFRTSNLAGASSGAGEAGGSIGTLFDVVAPQQNYYADLSLGDVGAYLGLEDPIAASGRIFISAFDVGVSNSNSAALRLGHFETASELTSGSDSIQLAFQRNVSTGMTNLIYSIRGNDSIVSSGALLTPNMAYDFSYAWDPNGGSFGAGGLSVRFVDHEGKVALDDTLNVRTAFRPALNGARFDAFGIRSGTSDGDVDWSFYIDDLQYTVTVVPEPSTAVMVLSGIAGLVALRKRMH